jgi:hypothetical protein
MKQLKPFILGLLLTVSFACSNDSEKEEVSKVDDDAINQLEETILDENVVIDNLSIQGATKKTGSPTPNGAISFTLDNPTSTAFLKNGFSIDFDESSDAFIGAYLQIKSVDGNLADGYWDINDITSKQSRIKSKSGKQAFSSKVSMTGGSVTVNFLDAIKPGKFCYAICVYDGSGNISLPSEVCVEVESWGGNSTLNGNWGFLSEEDIENGVSDGVRGAGEPDCEESFFYCDNGSTSIAYEYCDEITSLDLSFKSDGTYVLNEVYEYSDIDYEASASNCAAVAENGTSYYKSEGKWAYDEEEEILTLIEFYYDEDGDSETIPDGEVLFQGSSIVSNNVLTITDTEIDDSYTYQWILKFSKK